jgi:hypothetical protein
MKHLNTYSYCVAISGQQPVPAFWLNATASLASIRGNMDLEHKGWDD